MRPKSNRLRILRQQGYTLLLVLLLLGAAVGAALFSFFSTTTLTLERDQKTADALAAAKAALIGYTVRGGDCVPQPSCTPQNPQRPGEFPCPDTNNDGFEDGACVAGRLGRIPWKTLGIPEPKDSTGETLWYAVAGPFRSYNSGALNSSPINSDTRGNITVFATNGTTPLTDQAVAVIFAPGQALAGQNRDPNTTAACTTSPSSPVPLNRCAANYLETGLGNRNNATTNGPFIAGSRSDSYNDRVVYITTPEFIPIVEQRAAKELKSALQKYYDANAHFPFAAAFNDTNGNCKRGERRGRVPAAAGDCVGMSNWVTGATRLLPDWFVNNQWWRVMYYAVSPDYGRLGAGSDSGHDADKDKDKDKDKGRHNSSLDCSGGCLTVDGKTGISALFFTPGTPLAAINRPGNNLSDYLEDAENRDGWSTGANDIYVTPTAKTFDRDRIYTLAGGASTQQCANNAAALLALVPCGQPPKLNPQCTTLAANLAGCSCASAAAQMITTPCENTLNPSQCQSAVAALKSCTSGASGQDSGHDSSKGKK